MLRHARRGRAQVRRKLQRAVQKVAQRAIGDAQFVEAPTHAVLDEDGAGLATQRGRRQVAVDGGGLGVRAKERRAGEHLEEHETERENVLCARKKARGAEGGGERNGDMDE